MIAAGPALSVRRCPGSRSEVSMPYKLDGAKFPTLDDLVEALYPLYADKMSLEEFRAYAEENAEKT
jgi:hypothetical protein